MGTSAMVAEESSQNEVTQNVRRKCRGLNSCEIIANDNLGDSDMTNILLHIDYECRECSRADLNNYKLDMPPLPRKLIKFSESMYDTFCYIRISGSVGDLPNTHIDRIDYKNVAEVGSGQYKRRIRTNSNKSEIEIFTVANKDIEFR